MTDSFQYPTSWPNCAWRVCASVWFGLYTVHLAGASGRSNDYLNAHMVCLPRFEGEGMRARERHRTHKIAVLALIFTLMAWMWSGSAITAGADTVDQSNIEATKAPAGPKSAVAEESAEAPAAEFGVTKPMMVTRSRDAANHPTQPGEVKLFKDATAVDGMLNTWDVTLRVEAKDKRPETSDVVLVIDTSGSMNDRGRMDKAKEAAKAFVDELLPSETTHIGVVSFESNVYVRQPLTDDQEALKQAISGLHASGGTFTQGGIKQAREMLASSTADHKHIVLLSDGLPTFSYAMYAPDKYASRQYVTEATKDYYEGIVLAINAYAQATTSEAPQRAYNYGKPVGRGTAMFHSYSYKSTFGRMRTGYYNHGNSAIAEAGFAKQDNHVWSIGLQLDNVGNGIMQKIASDSSSFKGVKDVNELKPVFEKLAGKIAATIKDAVVTDPMGKGFEVPASNVAKIETVPANLKAQYNSEAKTIQWEPGALTTPIKEGSDIKYAELKYRVTINDDILKVNPKPANAMYPTNGDAQVSYTDAEDNKRTEEFPKPKVKPTFVTIEKKLYNEKGDPAKTDKNFTVTVTHKDSQGETDYTKDYVLNPAKNPVALLTALGDREKYAFPTGEYTFTESGVQDGELSDYSITYKYGELGKPELTDNKNTPVTVDVQNFDPKTPAHNTSRSIVVENRSGLGKLAITKELAGDATQKAKSLTYTGTYTCELGENKVEGTWSVTGAGDATLTPNGASQGETTVPVPVNYECKVIEKDPTGLNDKFYDFKKSIDKESVKIEKADTYTVKVTNTIDMKKGTLTWKKVDADNTSHLLGGSEWLLKGPGLPKEGQPIEDANKDGKFEVKDLAWGEYTLVEKLAPAGYILDTTARKVSIGEEAKTLEATFGDITNTKVVAPSIPLTGGISRDAYLYAGLITLVAGLALTVAYTIRRKAN